jgi:hypothetical protein
MTDQICLDLFIQDFVNTNRLMNQNHDWNTIVGRRYVEDGKRRIFRFQSGGRDSLAVSQLMAMPDADWLRIDMVRTEIPALPAEDFRFDCLRMMFQLTHYHMDVSRDGIDGAVIIRLHTRNRGLVNVAFVIRSGNAVENPFLI